MPTVGSLVVNLLGNAQQFNREMQSAKAAVSSLGSAVAAAAAATATIGAASSAVSLAAEYETTVASLTVLTGSAQQANKTLAELTNFAASTPFQLPEVEDAAKQLLSYQFGTNELIPTLKKLGDVSSALKIPMNDMVYLYGTSRAQAHLYAKDINQFASRGIPIISELAKVFGVSKDEIAGLVESGSVKFSHLEQVFSNLTGSGGQMADMMATMSGTLGGRFSNLQDNVTIAMREIGIAIVQAFDLKGVLEGAISATNTMKQLFKDYGSDIVIVVTALTGFASTLAAVRVAMLLYAAAQRVATVAGMIFQAVTSPVALIAVTVAISAAVLAMQQMDAAYDAAASSANKAATSNSNFAVSADKAATATTALHKATASTKELLALTAAPKATDIAAPSEIQRRLADLRGANNIKFGANAASSTRSESKTAIDAIGRIANFKAEVKGATPDVERMHEEIRMLSTSIFGMPEKTRIGFIDGLKAQIGDATGIAAEIRKITDEIEELKLGADQIALNKFESLKALPEDLKKLKDVQQQRKDTKQQDDFAQQAKQLKDSIRSPTEKLKDEIDKLNELKKSGHITNSEFYAGAEEVAKKHNGDDKTTKDKLPDAPTNAIRSGSLQAQEAIARAMKGGSKSNPNKKLETEAEKQTKGQKEVISYLREIASTTPPAPTVVDF